MSDVRLRDGALVEIRPIAPSDRELLRSGVARLSDRSRYLRFQAPVPSLSEQQLSYLTDIDHHNHEALLALDPQTGDAVAVARFVRVEEDVAECAIVVADSWQGRGLGTQLLDRLVQRAREEDVQRFTAVVLAENSEAIRMVDRLGDAVHRRSGAQVEVDVALADHVAAQEGLRTLLRGAAAGLLAPAITMWRTVGDFVYRRREVGPLERANTVVAYAQVADIETPALRITAALALARGANVHVVVTYWPVLSDHEETAQRLSAAAQRLRAAGLDVTVHVRAGDAVDAVIDVAQACTASMIVIDPTPSTGIMPWRPHALTDRVCARAPCDVLVAR